MRGASLSGLLGALAAPAAVAPVLAPRPEPWRVATYLTEALHGSRGARSIGAAARELAFALPACPMETSREAWRVASALQGAAMALPPDDRAPVVLALVRRLLDDAPTDAAVALDRAVVSARAAEGVTPTDTQRAAADRLLREVWP